MGMRVSVKCDAIRRQLVITQVEGQLNQFKVESAGFLPMLIEAENVAHAQQIAFQQIANLQRDPEWKAKQDAKKADYARRVASGLIKPKGRKPHLSKTA